MDVTSKKSRKNKTSNKKKVQTTTKKKDTFSSEDTTDFKTCEENNQDYSDNYEEKSPDFVFKHRKENIVDDVFDKYV